MMGELGLGVFIAGAVAYQAVVMAGLVRWLQKRGIRVPEKINIKPESTTERRKMLTVVVVFWVVCIAIIFGTW